MRSTLLTLLMGLLIASMVSCNSSEAKKTNAIKCIENGLKSNELSKFINSVAELKTLKADASADQTAMASKKEEAQKLWADFDKVMNEDAVKLGFKNTDEIRSLLVGIAQNGDKDAQKVLRDMGDVMKNKAEIE